MNPQGVQDTSHAGFWPIYSVVFYNSSASKFS